MHAKSEVVIVDEWGFGERIVAVQQIRPQQYRARIVQSVPANQAPLIGPSRGGNK